MRHSFKLIEDSPDLYARLWQCRYCPVLRKFARTAMEGDKPVIQELRSRDGDAWSTTERCEP